MKKLLLMIVFATPVLLFGQGVSGTSLQRITLTSVTLVMDSVRTPADMDLIRTEVTKHPEVKDFDIKNTNCDFTIDNTNNTLDVIFSDLAQRGQPARVYSIQANQTFTRVPEENCMSKKGSEVREEDSKKLGAPADGDR